MKKSLKNKLINSIRLFLVLATIISNFSFIPVVNASTTTYGKGEVINNSVTSNSGELAEGEIKLDKSISLVEGTDDTYTVTLTATGNDKVVEQSQYGHIYAAVVLDSSGSMGEEKLYCYEDPFFDKNDSYYPDYMINPNHPLYDPLFDPSLICSTYVTEGDKYNNAVSGAIKFSQSLLNKYADSQIALYQYYDDAKKERDFKKEVLKTSDFPGVGGDTNIAAGIEMATNDLLAIKKNKDPQAKLYMIVIGDGEPNIRVGEEETLANSARESGIEIYSIGYEVEKDSDAEKVLKSIADTESHYSRADISSVENTINDICGSIKVPVSSGKDATITDVISDEFEFVENSACIGDVCQTTQNQLTDQIILSNNNKNISFKVGDIGTATVSFKIKLKNRDLCGQNGTSIVIPTNDQANLDYTDPEGNNPEGPEITITDSPTINWIPDEYSYQINYYQDDLNNKIRDSITGTATLNKLIEVDENLRKPANGYNTITENLDFNISKDKNENIINVIYTKKNDLSYTINYYKDSILTTPIGNEIVNNQIFGTQITENDLTPVIDLHKPTFGYKSGVIQTNMPLTIQDGENVIDVLYEKRDDFSYTVKYVDEDGNSLVSNKEVNNVVYLTEVTEEALESSKIPFGYVLNDSTSKTEVIDEENEVIIFNYKKRNDLSYTVRYLEQGTNVELKPNKPVNNQTYLSTIKETAEDVFGYNLIVDNNANTNPRIMELNKDDMEIIFYYTKKTDFSYTVKYLDIETNEPVKAEKSVNNITYLTEVREEAGEIPYGYQLADATSKKIVVDGENDVITFLFEKRSDLSYTVKYLEEGTTTEIASAKNVTNKTYKGIYTENAITIPGYNVVVNSEQPNPRKFTLTRDGQEIIFYYTKKNNLTYTVNYYQDNLTNKIASVTEPNQVFESQIISDDIIVDAHKPFGYKSGVIQTNMPLIIQDGENIIDVLYEKRDDFSYTVKYLDENGDSIIEDKIVNDVTYMDEITEEALEAPYGYEIVGDDTKTKIIDAENIVITFNYEKRDDFKYTVKYLEQKTNKELSSEVIRKDKTYMETYKEEALTIKGYNLVTSDEMPNPRTITLSKDNMEVIFYYAKKNDLTYRVEYYYDDVLDESKTEYYIDKTFGDVIDSYEDKVIEGYVLMNDTLPLTIDDLEDNVIKVYYYSAGEGDIEPPKTGVEANNYEYIALLGLLFSSLVLTIKSKKEN